MEKQPQSKTDTHSENAPKRTISVHATGEAACPPDVLQFIVSVSALKDTVESAQTSVKRRTDYILQVLRNNGIKDRCIHCSSEISRGESVSMQTDVMVRADSLVKCETVRNLLVEKMDPSVRFTPISYHHTPETKDSKRYCTIAFLSHTPSLPYSQRKVWQLSWGGGGGEEWLRATTPSSVLHS